MMDTVHVIIHWLESQNWFLIIPAAGGYLNIVVVGSKVMGWNALASFCGKLEDALTAMVAAYLNRTKPKPEEKP